MSAFIVSGGSLLEIGCPSTLNRSTEQQVAFTSTLGGKRKAFVRRGGRRSWSVDVNVARPSTVATIEAVARNVGPVGWYPPEAVIGNLLSPQASGFDVTPANATDAGLVQLPDGSVARSVVHSGTGGVNVGNTATAGYEGVPVRAGEPITVAAWGLGGVRLAGAWRDAAGANVGAISQAVQSFIGWGFRSHTVTPPAGAVAAQLFLTSGSQYARPSVAWGTVARDEGGTGCPAAVIHSPAHSPVALWDGANYTDSSYSVTEVG